MIICDDVSVSFGPKKILRNLNWTFPETGVNIIRGPNGAGKTTLLNTLAGWQPPSSGTVIGPVNVGYIMQDERLFSSLSVLEHITLAARAHPTRSSVDAVLHRADLSDLHDATVSDLSGGQRRRLEIAIGTLDPTAPLLADEPTAHLDPRSRDEVLAHLQEIGSTRAVILVTHDLPSGSGNRELVLEGGRLHA